MWARWAELAERAVIALERGAAMLERIADALDGDPVGAVAAARAWPRIEVPTEEVSSNGRT